MQEILDEIEALFMRPGANSDTFFVIDRDGDVACDELVSYRTACMIATARAKDTGQPHFVMAATSVYVPQVTVNEYPAADYPEAR